MPNDLLRAASRPGSGPPVQTETVGQFSVAVVTAIRSDASPEKIIRSNRDSLIHRMNHSACAFSFGDRSVGGRPQDVFIYIERDFPLPVDSRMWGSLSLRLARECEPRRGVQQIIAVPIPGPTELLRRGRTRRICSLADGLSRWRKA